MKARFEPEDEPLGERLLTAEEVADLLAVSVRKVLLLPIKQIKIGPRLIRYRMCDVYDFIGIDNPNL